ncbi:MAG: lamin tail domain-containing protein, partial [Chthoniobacteraceae bacterium]
STAGVELINLGAEASTAGLSLIRVTPAGDVSGPVPMGIVPAGGFLQIPLALNAGDRLLLVAGDGATVLDSFEVKSTPRSRSPDGTGDWLRPVMLTPGAANQVALNDAIVINEIMFDPPADAYFAPGSARAGKWIELHNRSAASVDVGGWKLSDGVGFTFPVGTMIPAGGYIVVAEDPAAVIAVHGLATGQVFGPWSGSLSGRGERVRIEDANGNPADEVRYAGGGRWGEAPDGGGSSLELRDAAADNAVPEAWAASDESDQAAWQTFTWSGPNAASQTGEPTLWHELNLLLVDGPGECLIDDVRVTDTVTGTNLIQNDDFNAGAAHWRLLGNHRTSRVEEEPGQPGNQVLHLIASGAGEYQGNQIETTFIGNQALVNGRIYEISLRARWLSGGGRLNTRLYFNRIPRTNVLGIAPNGGTPGAPNSRAVANIGPTYRSLAHFPIVPDAGQPVTISVTPVDPQGVASMTLKYSVVGGAFQSVPMAVGDDGNYSAIVPGQTAGRTVQFYVEGSDPAGATSAFPARGPASRALYVVQDGQADGTPASVRLVMTTADANFMHTPVNTLSNEFIGATVITDEREVYYDVGVRLKGSFVGRNVGRVGFNLRFDPEHLFRGVLDKVAVDRSQHTTISVGEIIAKHIAVVAGGIPGMYDDIARFIHPLGTYTSISSLRLASFDAEYLDSQYPNGNDGQMFEFEVLRWNLATVDGNPESPKQPGNEGAGTGYANLEVRDWGNDQEAYRWNTLQVMHRDADDFSRIIAAEKLFSQSGAAFVNNAVAQLDVDEWLRTMAYQSLVGPADAVYTGSNIHNFRLYVRPHDGRIMYFPWDWDSAFQRATNAPLVGGGNIAKVVNSSPDLLRRYNAQLFDLIQTKFNSGYMARWTQHYGAVAGQSFSSILSYIAARAAYVQSQLPVATAFTASAGTVTGDGTVTISGTASIAVAYIEVNGVFYAPVWSSNTAWSIVVPLAPGENTLAIRGIGFDGSVVGGAMTTVTVNNPNGDVSPPLRINEWLAENDGAFPDPADGHSDDWFEIHNPTDAAVDLAGWKLSDLPGAPSPFVVPAGWTIPAGGFLLVWADNEPVQNPSTPGVGSALHVPFKLASGGDEIQLASPSGHVVDHITFGRQRSNRSEGRISDGAAKITGLTLPTPGSPNVLTVVSIPVITAGGYEVTFSTTPGLRYTLQRSGELPIWEEVAPAQTATGGTMTLVDPTLAPTGGNRFYRVLIATQ